MTSDGVVHERARDLPRLTSLRAFAALAVVLFHLAQFGIWNPGDAFDGGYSGVAFFFVLSGFVLTWTRGTSAATFYRRRFARVYPLHLAGLVLALVLPTTYFADPSVVAVVMNALLLQAWSLDSSTIYGLNAVSWSLSAEAAFYVAFPLLIAVATRFTVRTRCLMAVGYWLVTSAATLEAAHLRSGVGVVKANPMIRGSEFVLGIVLALAIESGWRPRWDWRLPAALLLLTAIAARWLPDPACNVPSAVAAVLLIAYAATADLDRAPGWLTHSWLVYAGQVSFALYIVHELIIENVAPHLPDAVTSGVLLVILSVGAAVILHHAVERPAQRLLTRRRTSVGTPA